MKKLMVFKHNVRYFVDDRASIYPAETPEEEYDISKLDENEINELKNGKKIPKKAIKLTIS